MCCLLDGSTNYNILFDLVDVNIYLNKYIVFHRSTTMSMHNTYWAVARTEMDQKELILVTFRHFLGPICWRIMFGVCYL